MNNPSPNISIIIPSLGRSEVLFETLDVLANQIKDSDEILIIDQNSPPLEIPQKFSQRDNIKFYWNHPPSLTKARNFGINKAAGGHVMFLDDDIIPNSDLIEMAKQSILQFPNHIIAGAVDQQDVPDVEGVGTVDLVTGEIKTNYNSKSNFFCEMFPGGHNIIPLHWAKSLKFSKHFKGSSQGEEIDFARRFLNKGGKIYFNSKMRIFHRKIPLGGCRSQNFKENFVFHQCFNEAYFWGRHGLLVNIKPFLRRMLYFLEFHSRKNGQRDWAILFKGVWELKKGFITGLITRPQ